MRILAIAALLPLAACGAMAQGDSGEGAAASGSGTTRSFAVGDFSKVELRGADDVVVTVGPAFAVRAEGPSKELEKLRITRDGGTLRIGRENSMNFNWGGSDNESVKVYVSMPRMEAASVAGSGDMTVDRVAGGDFAAAVAGSGDLSIGALQAASAKLAIAGSGGILAKGAAQSLDMSIAGSGDIDAGGLKASRAKVSIAGSGNAVADIAGPAEVSIMGSGSAQLGAGAKCTIDKKGAGEARCG